KLFGVMDALAADFSTNMTVGQMKTLADAARGIDPSAIDRVSVDDTNYLVDAATTDGQAVLVPRERSWAQLRAAVASLFMDSNIKAEAARVQLWNGSGVPGLAGSATTMLKDMGIQTLPPQNADSMDLIQTEIHDLTQGRDSSTVNYLASLFGAKIVADAPSTGASVDIEVVLGKNYQPPFAGIVDDYDSSLLAAGAAPQPVPSKAASQPKATPVTNDRPKSASTVEAKSPAKPRLTATRTVRSATIRVGLAATPRPTPAAVR
ncbi:MAG: LytR C-terminal domain-containing protein, partial [Chloroflexota bacterium]|nr:LytR C-terminal domain-containing protein [Chloroflexota bacterium]